MSGVTKNTWRENILNIRPASTADELTLTVESVFKVMFDDGIESINLSGFKPEAVSPIHLCVVLRAVSKWKDLVPGWHEARDVAKAACEYRGIDPNRAMTGLIK